MLLPLWKPSQEYIENSELYKFCAYIQELLNLKFTDYDQLHSWSIKNIDLFWSIILEYFQISYSGSYTNALEFNSKENNFINAKWFSGIEVSYAEHIFKSYTDNKVAIKFASEYEEYKEVSWQQLKEKVSCIQQFLIQQGVRKSDRIVGILNNRIDTIAIFLAVNSIGAIWSCCSPDFGDKAILERFEQIKPKILFFESSYQYNDKIFSKIETISLLEEKLKSLTRIVDIKNSSWNIEIQKYEPKEIVFTRVAFSHPIWILYSSGTTGKPKAITHSTGGNLIEHYKTLVLHQNLKDGENFLWYTTTGWMMWNYSLSSLLCGATLCIFDGIINHNKHITFWNFIKKASVDHLGAGSSYFTSIEDLQISDYTPKVIGSTGSPLPNQTFVNLQEKFPDVHIISLSGGTDVCSAFLSGCSFNPVYIGYIQCMALGADIAAYNEKGEIVNEEMGELVILKPMPSMPVYFWNDIGNEKYKESYFSKFKGVWSHGDWIQIEPKKGIFIYGRSDATLNRYGVRIGTAEIYNVLNDLKEIKDSLVITKDYENGLTKMILFVRLNSGLNLSTELSEFIKNTLRNQYSPRHQPDYIYQVSDIPYTLSGKKLELPIKRIFSGISVKDSINLDIMRNSHCIKQYVDIFLKLDN